MSCSADFALPKPRIGLVGAGWIGRTRLQALVNSAVAEIIAVAEPAPEARALTRQIVPHTRFVDTCAELLELELDGVVIASPSGMHAGQAAAALRRGRAVFCEKPLACTAAQTLAVIDIAKCANRLLAIDFSYRFTAAMRTIRELAHGGALGDIYAADLTFHNCYGPDKQWFYDPEQSGGGCVIDLGIHLIDALLWMLDFPTVSAVSADLFSQGKRLPRSPLGSVEDYAIATLEIENRVVARLACSWRLPIGRDASIGAVFYGTRASAEFSNVGGSFYDFRAELYQGRERRLLCAPPDDWGGRALIDWTQRLADDNRFDPAVGGVLAVAQTVDAIYGRACGEARRPSDRSTL